MALIVILNDEFQEFQLISSKKMLIVLPADEATLINLEKLWETRVISKNYLRPLKKSSTVMLSPRITFTRIAMV